MYVHLRDRDRVQLVPEPACIYYYLSGFLPLTVGMCTVTEIETKAKKGKKMEQFAGNSPQVLS